MNHCCEKCGKELEHVGDGPEWMNSYQWDAIKAGDYYAKCTEATHPNGNCYFRRQKDGQTTRSAVKGTAS